MYIYAAIIGWDTEKRIVWIYVCVNVVVFVCVYAN